MKPPIDVPSPRPIPLVFYKSAAGREPARDWIKSLDASDKRQVGMDLMQIQFGWPVGMPLYRSLGSGLWEARTNLSNGRVARVIFCFSEGELVALSGFIKKTQKTPPQDVETALKRKTEYEA
jgi:phage-related protein